MTRRFFLLALLLAAPGAGLAGPRPPAPRETLAVTGARVYTGTRVIENGVVLIEGGRVRAVEAGTPVPAGARVIDARGKVVMPGIVDAGARFGLRGMANEQAQEVTPAVRAAALVDPRGPEFQRALRSGVTAACVTPGSANVVGGLGAVVKTGGSPRLVRDEVALRAALGDDVDRGNSGFRTSGGDSLASIYGRRPNSRMATVWELRRALARADRSPVLTRVREGRLPVRIHARIENDIRVALTLADEFRLTRVILDEAPEAYLVADELAERKIPVVLGPLREPQAGAPEGEEILLGTPALLARRGVKIAFGSNGGDPTQLLAWGAFAVRYGLSPDAALRALTVDAADVAGVGDRIGSLEPGRDADLLVLSGEPFDLTTRIEKVLVNGRVLHEE